MKKFDIVRVQGQNKLIVLSLQVNQTNARLLYYVTIDEIFDILVEAHTKIGHGGRNKMLQQIQHEYKNITSETVMLFLNLCEQCQTKRSAIEKKKPTQLNQRG